MSIYIQLLLVTSIVVFIVDLSGFTDSWKARMSKWLGGRVTSFKPFDCSLCMTWWLCLLYSLVVGAFSLPVIAYIALLAFLARPLGSLIRLVWLTISNTLAFIGRLIDKI